MSTTMDTTLFPAESPAVVAKSKSMPESKSKPSGKSKSANSSRQTELDQIYKRKVHPHVARMPWVLRITDHQKRPSPVLVIKYRKPLDDDENNTQLVERGFIYGDSLRRCLPGIRQILTRVRDENDVPLELQQFIAGKQITFRGNLPLDEHAGAKLGLLFRLQQRVKDLDRVELMACRINKFTGEEASYWLSRMSHFGSATNRWAAAGLRIMLGGQPGDPAIGEMLRELDVD